VLITDHDSRVRQTFDALGDAAFAAAYRHGQTLPLDAVVACALDEPAGTPGEPGTARPLTRREAQVADLVAEGRSNREIATTLFISRRTAESHVEHILTKLGFTARTQIAAWVAEHRCAPDRISSPLPR
jgi:DNA-binding NarL/FixJ family response regulator